MGDCLNQMYEAAIESTMSILGFGGSVHGGFVGVVGGNGVRISPPGGR